MIVWLDCADPVEIEKSDAVGFTTNPTLWRGGEATLRRVDVSWEPLILEAAAGRPVSIEVTGMEGWAAQAERILGLGENVYVKIPIRTPAGESTAPLIASLPRVNATCCFTSQHTHEAIDAGAAIISVFAGRIADQGIDPTPLFAVPRNGSFRMLWASAREVYNVVQAESAGADIITLSPELYAKWKVMGRNLDDVCLDTVREFCQ